MRQFGIKTEEIAAKRVIFELQDKKLVIEQPQVTAMVVQGQKTFTVMGDAKEETAGIPSEDIELVAEQTGATKKQAEQALIETNGDIAQAIVKLKKN